MHGMEHKVWQAHITHDKHNSSSSSSSISSSSSNYLFIYELNLHYYWSITKPAQIANDWKKNRWHEYVNDKYI